MMYPVPFADIEDAVRMGRVAEDLGFDSVWGNDHMSTQRYVREEFTQAPRFYDPLGYLAYLAAETGRIRLATCVLVLPFRHPVAVAKQAATLDLLSGGRFVLGVGIGAYREEFEAMWPGRRIHRGEFADEFLESLTLLFRERRASYSGTWLSFRDVESFPKPLQDPLPILSGGNSAGARRRAASLGHGWLPACLTPQEFARGLAEIRGAARDHGRVLPDDFEAALQLVVSIAPDHDTAVNQFRSSQVFAHLFSLSESTLKDQIGDDMAGRNLVGTPDEIAEQVDRYASAGVTTFAGLLFATTTIAETIDAMTLFAEEVISRFSGPSDADAKPEVGSLGGDDAR